MFCENCGKELSAGAKFCEFCGAPVQAEGAPAGVPFAAAPGGAETAAEGTRVTENIYLCPDGKYRWSYAFDMLKNPVILFTTWKVLALAALIVALFGAVLGAIEGGIALPDPDGMKIIGILVIVFFVISVIAYLAVAASYGWKYMVLFEMDEEGVMHRQMKSQFKKAEAMGWIAAIAAAASGRPGMAGAGVLAATRTTMYSRFGAVRKVKANRGMHTIYVNELLGRNQVYAEDADFDFVLHYIKEHTGK